MNGLNVRQEAFCLEYAKTGNAKQSLLKAGYKDTSADSVEARASRMLGNVKVQQRIRELADEVKDDTIADIREMQERLTQIIRQQMDEDVIVTESDMEGGTTARVMKKTAAIKDVISAVNTLGKMQGCFTDKLDVSGTIPVVISGDDGLDD